MIAIFRARHVFAKGKIETDDLRNGNVPNRGIMGGDLLRFAQAGVVNHHHFIPRLRCHQPRRAGEANARGKMQPPSPRLWRPGNAKREESASGREFEDGLEGWSDGVTGVVVEKNTLIRLDWP